MLAHFITKTVPFKFRGINLKFDLSQGLFSSTDIDTGTRLLLKVFSRLLDDDTAAGKPLPEKALDSGCGCGVIGICAASAISRLLKNNGNLLVHCQDRDELARLVTLHNAAKNGIPPSILSACTEPLLASGCSQERWQAAGWDIILTNIPAKAGAPVLEDFVRRSADLLNPGGRVIMVAVHTLEDFFRKRIAADAELLQEEQGSGHCVFVYGKAVNHSQALINNNNAKIVNHQYNQVNNNAETDFFTRYPFYVRAAVTYPIEEIPVYLETLHGSSGFDNPGGAVLAAAKFAARINRQFPVNAEAPLLIHEPDQGFFPCWLLKFLQNETAALREPPVLSGRNILSLEASRRNIARYNAASALIVPAVDLRLGETSLLEAAGGRRYGYIAAFPELLPQSALPKGVDQLAILWDALPPLLEEGGIFLVVFGSHDAERFDRKKPSGFTRLGSIKRDGFRALAYHSD